MRRAALLYNPNAGRRSATHLIDRIAEALRNHNIETQLIPTEGPGTAGRQASEACRHGIDILFACGGDGTIHEVLQGMAFQPHTALGIIPLGSANAFARHLGLGLALDPIRAALQQLAFEPTIIPIGKVTYQTPTGEASRYFLVMAGAGPDGALVYNMLGKGKHRLGRAMYYLRSAHLFLTTRFSPFDLTANTQTTQAVSAMAVRVADLGGLFSPLIRGASLEDPQLLLTTVAAPARLSLPVWFVFGWARLHHLNRYVQTHRVGSFATSEGQTAPVQIQADGEWLGRTPMTVTLIPNALRLLMPIAR